MNQTETADDTILHKPIGYGVVWRYSSKTEARKRRSVYRVRLLEDDNKAKEFMLDYLGVHPWEWWPIDETGYHARRDLLVFEMGSLDIIIPQYVHMNPSHQLGVLVLLQKKYNNPSITSKQISDLNSMTQFQWSVFMSSPNPFAPGNQAALTSGGDEQPQQK